MKKILVLGSTGFVGKEVVKNLKKNDNYDVVQSSLSLGLDLRDIKSTILFFEKIKPDYVINCAAYVGGIQFGYKNSADVFYNNMSMQLSILEACKLANVKRLINPIGSCAYPGDLTIYKEDEFWNGPIHKSVMSYGTVKKAFCVASEVYNIQYNLDIINLVMSNMYGPGDHFEEERAHAVGALIKKIILAKKNNLNDVRVFGTGKPIREWLYITDAVKAIIRALDIEPYNSIINIGTGIGYTIKETVDMLVDIIGYKGNVFYDTTMIDGALCKTVDGSLGKKLLGWKPDVNFIDGLKLTVDWYIKELL